MSEPASVRLARLTQREQTLLRVLRALPQEQRTATLAELHEVDQARAAAQAECDRQAALDADPLFLTAGKLQRQREQREQGGAA